MKFESYYFGTFFRTKFKRSFVNMQPWDAILQALSKHVLHLHAREIEQQVLDTTAGKQLSKAATDERKRQM